MTAPEPPAAHSARVRLNGVEIDYAVSGPAQGRPLLMIMGLGMQRTAWPESLLGELQGRGFRCITYDNRDIGHSTRYTEQRWPSVPATFAARMVGRRLKLPYSLADIADDAAALLGHLGYAAADIAGISMGGMIAQHFAHRYPARTRSLTLLATSSGRMTLPMPRGDVMRIMLTRPKGQVDVDRATQYMVRLFTAIGSPGYPMPRESLERRVRAGVLRAPAGAAVTRQLTAIMNDGDRTAMLRKLTAPTLILHGEADPLVPFAHGLDLARCLPNALFERIAGWGHDLPDALAPHLATLIERHAAAQARRA